VVGEYEHLFIKVKYLKMKHSIITALLAISIIGLHGCYASKEKERMDRWLGRSKQNLIAKWGLPYRQGGNGSDGEVMVYLKNFNYYYNRQYTFYIDHMGTIYSWRSEPVGKPAVRVYN